MQLVIITVENEENREIQEEFAAQLRSFIYKDQWEKLLAVVIGPRSMQQFEIGNGS